MNSIALKEVENAVEIPAYSDAFPVPHVREGDPLGSRDEPELGTRWIHLKADAPVKVTEGVLASFREKRSVLEAEIKCDLEAGREPGVRYLVFASERPDVFSLGGDLTFFKDKIAAQDRESLTRYARECIDLVYDTVTGMRLPLTTISLVRGAAQGGGFEFALAHNVVVAERGATMGLPEIMFNMFPGMGAYQLLCRRVPAAKAEQLILSGRTYPVEELYDMGVVDILTEQGKGEEAVRNYIRRAEGRKNGRNALRQAIQKIDPFDYEDLEKVVDVWVDAAFNLSAADLKMMDYLVRAQARMRY